LQLTDSKRFSVEYQLYIFQRHQVSWLCLEAFGVFLWLQLANQVVKRHTLRL